MSKNVSTGFIRQLRKRKADKRGGSPEIRYKRYLKQIEADRKAIVENEN